MLLTASDNSALLVLSMQAMSLLPTSMGLRGRQSAHAYRRTPRTATIPWTGMTLARTRRLEIGHLLNELMKGAHCDLRRRGKAMSKRSWLRAFIRRFICGEFSGRKPPAASYDAKMIQSKIESRDQNDAKKAPAVFIGRRETGADAWRPEIFFDRQSTISMQASSPMIKPSLHQSRHFLANLFIWFW